MSDRMSEIMKDPTREPKKMKIGPDVWGYRTRRHLAMKNDELARRGITDRLTGLLNRGGWDHDVQEIQKLAERSHEPVSFLLIDLDNFKHINDTQGHKAGDEILQVFSDFLREKSRDSDIIARYGGDEFAICMYGADLTEAKMVIDRLTESGKEIDIGFSIGAGKTFEEADKAMYEMKNSRKNNA